jgi:hypothetical protein
VLHEWNPSIENDITKIYAIINSISRVSYHGFDAEHVAVMVLGGVVFGDVGEMRQVIGVLAGAVDVPDLMLAHQFLRGHN